MKQPMQPVILDAHGVARFKVNVLVRHLLDNGGLSMNDLARVECSKEDAQQFAMLIGYSVDGYGSLSYADDTTYDIARVSLTTDKQEIELRAEYLEAKLSTLKAQLREPMASLFEVHPDNLDEEEV